MRRLYHSCLHRAQYFFYQNQVSLKGLEGERYQILGQRCAWQIMHCLYAGLELCCRSQMPELYWLLSLQLKQCWGERCFILEVNNMTMPFSWCHVTSRVVESVLPKFFLTQQTNSFPCYATSISVRRCLEMEYHNGACHALWPWKVLKALRWLGVWQPPLFQR